jgi:hypothetical protein
MIIRKIASTLFAALIVSASLAAAAGPATAARHPRAAMHHATKARSSMQRDSGSAATDALNEQSLTAARGGAAPAMAAPSMSTPSTTMPQ